jgi:hypothetical protein
LLSLRLINLNDNPLTVNREFVIRIAEVSDGYEVC